VTSSKSARRARRDARRRPEPRTEPIPRLRTAAYDAGGRPAILIGDTLARDPEWAPRFAILPCGHCGAGFDGARPADLLHLANPLTTVKARAWEAGWRLDVDQTLTCPPCQQDRGWKARQGPLAIRQPGSTPDDGDCPWHDLGARGVWCTCPRSYCDRHDRLPVPGVPMHEYRCTCPGAVLAVDVMLASNDYLGTGHGRHRAVTR
jgi:hypothetical protein